MSSFGIIALTPVSFASDLEVKIEKRANTGSEQVNTHYAVAFAAKRAGETGVINLEMHDLSNLTVKAQVTNALTQLAQESGGRYGIKYGAGQNIDATVILKSVIQSAPSNNAADITVIISSPVAEISVTQVETAMKGAKALGCAVLLEATSRKEAVALAKLSPDGLVVKGSEAGGITAETTAYILLQETITAVDVPVWVQGGIGLYSSAACYAAGAAGLVLDSQLLLTRESSLPVELKQKIAAMDGTEITTISIDTNKKFRSFARQGHPIFDLDSKVAKVDSLADIAAYLPAPGKEISAKREDVLLVIGQDIALAKNLAEKYVSVAGILEGLKDSAIRLAALAGEQQALKPNSALAESHKTEYPIVQGAMTRVSDTAEFALSVAEGGGLPFLALSLMRGGESETLVSKTKELLKDKPWGVGILGFVPAELRNEQLAVINKYKPPFALIAGGRPDQAKSLEDTGIATYLHVPSPLLLQSFIEMGARRFIFEGRECGGHVGPRSSFVLWEQMIDILANVSLAKQEASKFHILMAGGIHDGMSAAMVAAMTAPLTERGMKVGVLVGTAYLFTKEAVEAGAIVDKFQEAAIACSETVLLETGPGHAIRCIDSPYKRIFDNRRVELTLLNKTKDEVREELELMNLCRLRIASKGVSRPNEKTATRESTIKEMSESGKNSGEKNRQLVEISKEEQWADGMYMIGQVASMHDKVLTIKELHQSVSEGSVEVLEKLPEFAHLTKNQQITAAAANASQRSKPRRDGWDNIAIVGMSCMFPKASDVHEYWHNILNKVDAIEEVPIEQWDWKNYYDQDPLARDKIISKWGGFLQAITFDPTKYGIPPSSLTSIDPMQLMLLEVTQRALEDAGYSNRSFGRKKTSVILANAGHGPVTALMSLRSMLGWKLAHL
ncbi:MAG: nitronate monooxygenase, partial [Leptolyngbya sp.]|nr:nitronate monooxygenase [Candidatus Melainabacteria bacterium]